MALTKVSRGLLSTSIVDNGNATAITIDANENVGIGTASPSVALQVSGQIKNNNGYLIDNGTNAGFLTVDGSNVNFGSSTAAKGLAFFTAATSQAMTIDSSGDVGIGTSSPSAPIEISRSNSGIIQYITNTGSTQAYTAYGNSDNPPWSQDFNTPGGLLVGIDSDETAIVYQGGNKALRFGTNATERMRIDASGNVGIGAASVTGNLQILTATAGSVLNVNHNTSNIYPKASGIGLGATSTALTVSSDGSTVSFTGGAGLYAENTAASGNPTNLVFWTNLAGSPAEAMRIDASGNLLVGDTSATFNDTAKTVIRPSADNWVIKPNICTSFNRTASNGDILEFYQGSSSKVGSIGSIAGGYLTISGTTGGRLQINGTDEYSWDTTQFYPTNDNANDLGFFTKRWDDIYATNGTIQTSDRNEKQDIEALSDAEQRVAVAAKGLLRKFRWIDAVEAKGDDARIHFGIIAQDLQDAFTAEGLDAGRYAMFINSTWTDEETGEERSRMGVRYSELLAFIISAI